MLAAPTRPPRFSDPCRAPCCSAHASLSSEVAAAPPLRQAPLQHAADEWIGLLGAAECAQQGRQARHRCQRLRVALPARRLQARQRGAQQRLGLLEFAAHLQSRAICCVNMHEETDAAAACIRDLRRGKQARQEDVRRTTQSRPWQRSIRPIVQLARPLSALGHWAYKQSPPLQRDPQLGW
eukprot:356133-Chlamydomonas_euryale.AAC.32